jgi:hypothetical protein
MGFNIGPILRTGRINDIHCLSVVSAMEKLAIANSFLLTAKRANLPFSSVSSISLISFSGRWRSLSYFRMLLMHAIVAYAENFFHQVAKFWIWPSNIGSFSPLLNE